MTVIPFPAAVRPLMTSYSEASYFDGYHFQHIAAWEEHRRLKRIRDNCRQMLDRRRNGRA